MEHDALSTVYSILSETWADFEFKKSKRTWARETRDRVLLMVQCQGSRWSAMFYLNFGVYYLDMQPIMKPMSNLPKPSDWHLFSRYGAFREMSAAEQNDLFSLEDTDPAVLKRKCVEIASFCQNNILPQLEVLGIVDILKESIEKRSDKAFHPFNTQRVAKKDIVAYVQGQSSKRLKSD